jgi:ketosteroid isomerase-like protein
MTQLLSPTGQTSAFNAHDLDGLGGALAEDVVFSAPGPVAGQGRAACVAFFRHWLEEFPDAHLSPDAVHVAGDLTVEHGLFTGTHDGVARTGRSVAIEYVQLLRCRDAKLVAMTLMFDRLAMLEQLGLVRQL